ncbi:CxxC motif protein [Halorubrum phage Hardycor1]|nr:CxxC motif protein [Halorubrum phage Hardycor1]
MNANTAPDYARTAPINLFDSFDGVAPGDDVTVETDDGRTFEGEVVTATRRLARDMTFVDEDALVVEFERDDGHLMRVAQFPDGVSVTTAYDDPHTSGDSFRDLDGSPGVASVSVEQDLDADRLDLDDTATEAAAALLADADDEAHLTVQVKNPDPHAFDDVAAAARAYDALAEALGTAYDEPLANDYDDEQDEDDDLPAPSFHAVDEYADDEPRRTCRDCGGEAVHADTRRVNGWINEASAYDSHSYECVECGETGAVTERGDRTGILAPREGSHDEHVDDVRELVTDGGEDEFEPFDHESDYDPDEGDEVTVRYESSRSDERQSIDGVVTSVRSDGVFWIDTGDEFDDGTPKTYMVGYRSVTGTDRRGADYRLTPAWTSGDTVEVRLDRRPSDDPAGEAMTDGGVDEGDDEFLDPAADTLDDAEQGDRVRIAYESPQAVDPVERDAEVLDTGGDGVTLVLDRDDADERRVHVAFRSSSVHARGPRVESLLATDADDSPPWRYGNDLGALVDAEPVDG